MMYLEKISKHYPGFSLNSIDLHIRRGEYFVLLGRSGSGKSMLLQLIAGFRRADGGRIVVGGRDITRAKIQHRNVILMHQDTNLFPHLTVFDNIAYPLRCRKVPRRELSKRVEELAGVVAVGDLLYRYPGGLSGGEAQRVALARSLAVQPDILLLDEPLAALDIQLHAEMKSLLYKIHQGGQTVLHVTHDYDEAVSLADRLAVIDNGSIMQVGTAREMEDAPQSAFVARLTGIRNFYRVAAPVGEPAGGNVSRVAIAGHSAVVNIPTRLFSGQGFLVVYTAYVSVSLVPPVPGSSNVFEGVIGDIVPGAASYELVVDAGFRITAPCLREEVLEGGLQRGSRVWVTFPPEACRLVEDASHRLPSSLPESR
jgi:molybdate/tungstate transport system ATP-binding protein